MLPLFANSSSCIPSTKNNLWLRSPCFLPVMASEKSQGINVPQGHSQPPSGKSWCINTPVPLAMKGRNSEVFVLVCLPEFPYGIKLQLPTVGVCMIMYPFNGCLPFCFSSVSWNNLLINTLLYSNPFSGSFPGGNQTNMN